MIAKLLMPVNTLRRIVVAVPDKAEYEKGFFTRDLNTPAGQHAAITTARRLREEGAAVIALACTGFSTIGLAPQLERAAGIPVLDPVTCEAQALLALLA